jgi:hypothetical protein
MQQASDEASTLSRDMMIYAGTLQLPHAFEIDPSPRDAIAIRALATNPMRGLDYIVQANRYEPLSQLRRKNVQFGRSPRRRVTRATLPDTGQ